MAQFEQDYRGGRGGEWLNVLALSPDQAKKRIAINSFSSRNLPFRDENRRSSLRPTQPVQIGKFRVVRGTGKDCIDELRSAVDNPSDYWCLVVSPCPTAGSILTDERPAGPHELYFQPLSRGDESAFGAASVLMMLFPAEMFIDCNVALEKVRFTVPNTGLGALLVDYMLLLEQRLPTLSEDELQPPINATRLLIRACLAGEPCSKEDFGQRRCGSRMQRAHALIRENLQSPTFGEADIRRALGISRSSLYRLFAPLGGVKRCIQRERLAQARILLADPHNEKPIFKVAEELCFCDASSFSRAFRNEFGISPRAVRDHPDYYPGLSLVRPPKIGDS